MKPAVYFLLAVAVLALQAHAAALTSEEKQTVKNFYKECISETGVDTELTRKLLKASGHTTLLDDNDTLKQYVLCLYKKGQVIDAEGLLHKDRLKKGLSKYIADEVKLDEVVNKCAVQKDTPLETAAEMLKCIKINESPAVQE